VGLWTRMRGWWDDLRDSLWLVPALVIVVSVGAAWTWITVGPASEGLPGGYSGTPEGARAVLTVLATSTITVTGLVFSLTVIALQMASSQFTPRLLRSFLRDRPTQVVLGGMLGSASHHVTVLLSVRGADDEGGAFVPEVGVSFSLLYGLVAIALLVYFLHHITQSMRVDVVMRAAATSATARIRRSPQDQLPDLEPQEPPANAEVVLARRSGYLQTVQMGNLARELAELDARCRLRASIGSWVTEGTILAWWWPTDEPDPERSSTSRDDTSVEEQLHRATYLGPDRTESGDLVFEIRQLVDIGLRALSTGVNDPTTACQAIHQLTDILTTAARWPLGVVRGYDDDGHVRVELPQPTFAALLALGLDQLRSAGREDTDVLVALLGLCTDLGEHVADSGDRRDAVAAQVERIAEAAKLGDSGDRERVSRAAEGARRTLASGRRPSAPTEAG
jgi:uncharacterized membrane protein